METGVSREIIDHNGPLYERLTGHLSTAGAVPGDTEFEDPDFDSLRFRDIADGVALGEIALDCVGWSTDLFDYDESHLYAIDRK